MWMFTITGPLLTRLKLWWASNSGLSPVSQFCRPTEIFVSGAEKIFHLEQINVILA